MTDADLIAKKLAFIETCVTQLRTLARLALLATDIREERFVEHRGEQPPGPPLVRRLDPETHSVLNPRGVWRAG
jgi:hypothetical protein